MFGIPLKLFFFSVPSTYVSHGTFFIFIIIKRKLIYFHSVTVIIICIVLSGSFYSQYSVMFRVMWLSANYTVAQSWCSLT